MYCIARKTVLPSLTQEQRDHLLAEAALHSLAEVLEAVPDPRGKHGLRYDLPFLLTCLIAALLCNCDGSEAVAQWCRDHVALLQNVFGPRLFLSPSGSLYRWLLPQLDASALEQVLGRWVQATTAAACDEPLALDGKTLRGARSEEHAAPHLLSFVTHQSQETFFQVRVDEKTNEIPVAKQVLPTLPIRSRVCTADALHTHAAFICLIHELGAETVLTVKGNQPTLFADHLLFRSASTLPASRDCGSPTRTHFSTYHQGQHRDECLSRCLLALRGTSCRAYARGDQGWQHHHH